MKLGPRRGTPDPQDMTAVRQWVRARSRPTAIDVFCGAGGLSLGLKEAGFSVLVGADSDPLAIETHVANLGGLGYLGDLADVKYFLRRIAQWGIKTVDVIAAGLPCQPFSSAGRPKIRSLVADGLRHRNDPRTTMWCSFLRIVKALRPRAVILENVPDMAVWEEGEIVIGTCETLRELGYATTARILNAFDYGVPQHRRRLFIVGVRAGMEFDWPRRRGPCPSLREAIGDLPVARPAQRKESLPYRGPKTAFQRRMRIGVVATDRDRIYDHITRDVRPDDAQAFDLLKPRQTYADLPRHLQRYDPNGFKDKYNRLGWDDLSRSITAHLAKDGYWYIHPSQNRTLSIREAARIQTFPDWYRFAGRPSRRFGQIGNAVPPFLAHAVGRRLIVALSGRSVARTASRVGQFRGNLLRWHQRNRRNYPWRRGATPWRILMAEICLRRTRADQVVPVYRQLVRIASTPEAMVRHSRRVRKSMSSLGLKWRVDNMIAIARKLVRNHGGRLPAMDSELRELPGVGDYVSGAVRVFGRGGRAVLIDTNTSRIVKRVFGQEKKGRWQLRLDLYELAGRRGPDAAFNYALLDFGALICRARDPLCEQCPVRSLCSYYAKHRTGSRQR